MLYFITKDALTANIIYLIVVSTVFPFPSTFLFRLFRSRHPVLIPTILNIKDFLFYFIKIHSLNLNQVTQDVPRYTMVAGDRAELRGLNLEGLRRNGFSDQEVFICYWNLQSLLIKCSFQRYFAFFDTWIRAFGRAYANVFYVLFMVPADV